MSRVVKFGALRSSIKESYEETPANSVGQLIDSFNEDADLVAPTGDQRLPDTNEATTDGSDLTSKTLILLMSPNLITLMKMTLLIRMKMIPLLQPIPPGDSAED